MLGVWAHPDDEAFLAAGVMAAARRAGHRVVFGIALGAALARTGLPPGLAWSSSPLLFGGAAQLVAVQLLAGGAPAVVVVAASLVVNARMLLYSASLAPHARGWPRRWRRAGAYLLVDPVYALAVGRFGGDDGGGSPADRLRYYRGAGVTHWAGWMALTAAGVLLGGLPPTSLPLGLAAPLTFLVLLLPMLTGRAACAAAVPAAPWRCWRRACRWVSGCSAGRPPGSPPARSSGGVMRELAILVVIGAGTYLMRVSFLVAGGSGPPRRLARVLPHLGPAVLAALVVPALVAPHGHVAVGETVPALIAATGCWLLWRRTARLPLALFGGLGLWRLFLWSFAALGFP